MIFIHPPVDGHIGCFHFPVIVSSAAINTRVKMSLQQMDRISLGCDRRLDHFIFNFFEDPPCYFSLMATRLHIPTNSV